MEGWQCVAKLHDIVGMKTLDLPYNNTLLSKQDVD